MSATATKPGKDQLSQSPIWGAPVNIQEHEEQLRQREEERAKNRHLQRKCLNPEVAAQMEARKPLYEWSVKATYMAENPRNGLKEETTVEKTILAQNERDAWARFGDQLGFGLAPKSCEREITRLKQVN